MAPRRVHQMRAVDLTAVNPPAAGYLFRDYGDRDHAWKLVKTWVICELAPHEGAFLPAVVTVKFADGTVRFFNPDDQVEIGPA
ncbi:MAG: hypothetical protein WBZ37_27015 [Mycobacterium sp.]